MHLFSALAEAAELEHNLMCLYLYAMFSLKRSEDEGISKTELAAIEGWRKIILSIALEEMTHLALVSNLFSALGESPHFLRPNFPVSPGLYPANIVIELAPFNLQTLEHFIYLERPRSQPVQDSEEFTPRLGYERPPLRNRLMPSSSDYETVGDLYDSLKTSLTLLCEKLGEKILFCGSPERQITPTDSPLPGLGAITDLKSALQAIETIVVQGEGASQVEDSHFSRFRFIHEEYTELLKQNPDFNPSRPVVRNPVMRKPIDPEGRVWVTEPIAASYMDVANALYGLMLRLLVQSYLNENRDRSERHELLQIAFGLMHAMAAIGETLTLLPVSIEDQEKRAGMSFAMVRTLAPLAQDVELPILKERLCEFVENLRRIQNEVEKRQSNAALQACALRLATTSGEIEKMTGIVDRLIRARGGLPPLQTKEAESAAPEESKTDLPVAEKPIEYAEGKGIRISFNSHLCIHSRHCVTELPGVFKANTPGEWLFPDESSAEVLAAVIRECPSGALQYESKGECQAEPLPPVNLVRVYENGPYAFSADLRVDGKPVGYRSTLCRCGRSRNKPFCDHSHADIGFIATGEPETLDATELKSRSGPLHVNRLRNGPLQIEGNLETCAATGRVVARTTKAHFCRCGHSKSKPFCDNTHQTIGFQDGGLP